jgi:hypothetical protein
MSDLDHNFRFVQIYDDACDIGFTLQSARTGVKSNFFLEHEEWDEEGELRFWRLHPTAETLRRCPTLKGTRVIIWND